MREIVLFSGKIYTPVTNLTRPPVVTVATNLNSACRSHITHFAELRQRIEEKRAKMWQRVYVGVSPGGVARLHVLVHSEV